MMYMHIKYSNLNIEMDNIEQFKKFMFSSIQVENTFNAEHILWNQ